MCLNPIILILSHLSEYIATLVWIPTIAWGVIVLITFYKYNFMKWFSFYFSMFPNSSLFYCIRITIIINIIIVVIGVIAIVLWLPTNMILLGSVSSRIIFCLKLIAVIIYIVITILTIITTWIIIIYWITKNCILFICFLNITIWVIFYNNLIFKSNMMPFVARFNFSTFPIPSFTIHIEIIIILLLLLAIDIIIFITITIVITILLE